MKIFYVAFPLCIALLLATQAMAAHDAKSDPDDSLVPPVSALLTPGGGRLNVVQKAVISEQDGKPVVKFVIPANAGNLQMNIPGQTIARWSSTPVLLNNGGPFAGRRAVIEQEKIDVTAQLMTVNSRLQLWQSAPKSASAQEMEQLQSAMQTQMPMLVQEQAQLEQRLKLINEELTRMPNPSDLGERVRVILAGDPKPGTEVEIRYSYSHDGCGWEPVYDFNAVTDQGEGGVIDVRLIGEIWQFTGINWPDTEIVLATHGSGPRAPAPLPEWVVDSAKTAPAPQPRVAAKAATMSLAAESADAVPAANAAVTGNADTMYASWNLSQKGLPQGRSRLEIGSSVWKTPLQWLARPSLHNNQVWMLAKCDLPQDLAWPSGLAEYSVNGQSVGSGDFRPTGSEVTLFFGPDPRVTVQTYTDSRTRGQSGFINANKTWTWSWTYTINNMRNQPVQVRVERPAPQIVDKGITVTYKDNPAALQEQHMLVWTVDVPAHGKKSIDHSVTISSPNRLPLLPEVP